MSSVSFFLLVASLLLFLQALATPLLAASCLASQSAPIPASYVIGQPSFTESTSDFSALSSIAISPASGKLFVGHSEYWTHPLSRFATSALAMNGGLPELSFGTPIGSSSCSAALTNSVSDLFIGCDDILYVSDRLSSRVGVIESASSLSNSAVSYSKIYGQPSFTVCTPGSSNAKMNTPYGIYKDVARDILYVSDYGLNRIMIFINLSSKPAVGATANRIFGSLGCSANTFKNPSGITVDQKGHLWVSDYGNHRVVRYNNAHTLTGASSASLVVGRDSFDVCSAPSTASQSTFRFPYTIAFDLEGTLYVADGLNYRVMGFSNGIDIAANGALADFQIGQSSFDARVFNSTLSATNLQRPKALAFDSKTTQALLVGDILAYRIMRYCSNGAAAGDLCPSPSASLSPPITRSGTASLSPPITRSADATGTGTASIPPSVTGTANPTGSISTSLPPSVTGTASLPSSITGTANPTGSDSASLPPSVTGTASLPPSVTGTANPTGSDSASLPPSITGTASLPPSVTGTANPTGSASASLPPSITGTANPTGSDSASLPPSITGTANSTGSVSGSVNPSVTGTASNLPSITRSANSTGTASVTSSSSGTASTPQSSASATISRLSASIIQAPSRSKRAFCGDGIVEGKEECDPPSFFSCCNIFCRKSIFCLQRPSRSAGPSRSSSRTGRPSRTSSRTGKSCLSRTPSKTVKPTTSTSKSNKVSKSPRIHDDDDDDHDHDDDDYSHDDDDHDHDDDDHDHDDDDDHRG